MDQYHHGSGVNISTAGGTSGSSKPPNNQASGNRQSSGSINYGARGGRTVLNNSAESLLRQTTAD